MVSILYILAPLGKDDRPIIKFAINFEMKYQQPHTITFFNKGIYDDVKYKINIINRVESLNKYP